MKIFDWCLPKLSFLLALLYVGSASLVTAESAVEKVEGMTPLVSDDPKQTQILDPLVCSLVDEQMCHKLKSGSVEQQQQMSELVVDCFQVIKPDACLNKAYEVFGQSYQKIYDYWTPLCSGGFMPACYYQARFYQFGYLVEEDALKALNLFKHACAKGLMRACHSVGYILTDGDEGIEEDRIAALGFYTKSCQSGYAYSCFNMALLFENCDVEDMDPVKSAQYFKLGCDAGDGVEERPGGTESCFELAEKYEEGNGVDQDVVEARRLYKFACDKQHGEACNSLGILYFDGNGVSKDVTMAMSLWEKACDLEEAYACENAAQEYHFADEIPKDYKRAASFYNRGCELDGESGCHNLAYFYKNGFGVEQSYEKAIALYDISCHQNYDEDSCYNLGLLYRDGEGVARSWESAKELFTFACSLGDKSACEEKEPSLGQRLLDFWAD